MDCKICNEITDKIFLKLFLNKYLVSYYKCKSCQFIQTEDPYWLAESYSSKLVAGLDVGCVQRNLTFSVLTKRLITHAHFNGRFIDYGGGSGLFVRLMRDYGFDFYWHDLYSNNLFANHFSISDLTTDERQFSLLTAFEVFEHLVQPMTEIEKMLQYSKAIFISTELYPAKVSEIENWWYLVPEGGQHISLYSRKTLTYIANYFGLNYYTDGSCYHLLAKDKINNLENLGEILSAEDLPIFEKLFRYFLKNKLIINTSLIEHDYEIAKKYITQ